MHFLARGTERVSQALSSVGIGVLAVMMFLTASNVTLRYVFNRPIVGAYELTELMMVVLIFFSLAYTQVKKGHIAIKLVASRLPQRAQAIVNSIVYFVSLGLFSLVVWRGVVEAQSKHATGLETGALAVPIWPFYLLLAFGCLVMCLALLVDLLGSLSQGVRK